MKKHPDSGEYGKSRVVPTVLALTMASTALSGCRPKPDELARTAWPLCSGTSEPAPHVSGPPAQKTLRYLPGTKKFEGWPAADEFRWPRAIQADDAVVRVSGESRDGSGRITTTGIVTVLPPHDGRSVVIANAQAVSAMKEPTIFSQAGDTNVTTKPTKICVTTDDPESGLDLAVMLVKQPLQDPDGLWDPPYWFTDTGCPDGDFLITVGLPGGRQPDDKVVGVGYSTWAGSPSVCGILMGFDRTPSLDSSSGGTLLVQDGEGVGIIYDARSDALRSSASAIGIAANTGTTFPDGFNTDQLTLGFYIPGHTVLRALVEAQNFFGPK